MVNTLSLCHSAWQLGVVVGEQLKIPTLWRTQLCGERFSKPSVWAYGYKAGKGFLGTGPAVSTAGSVTGRGNTNPARRLFSPPAQSAGRLERARRRACPLLPVPACCCQCLPEGRRKTPWVSTMSSVSPNLRQCRCALVPIHGRWRSWHRHCSSGSRALGTCNGFKTVRVAAVHLPPSCIKKTSLLPEKPKSHFKLA